MTFTNENPTPITRKPRYVMSDELVRGLAEALDSRSASDDYIKDETEYNSASTAHNARDRYINALIAGKYLPDTKAGRKAFSASTRKVTETRDGEEVEFFNLYLKVEPGTIKFPKAD